ncbi:MAG: TolB family protein [Rhodothermales bacterium]
MKTIVSFVFAGCLLLAGLPRSVQAQAPPGTDILLVPLHNGEPLSPENRPVNLTDRDGYDNQPFFTPDGRSILFTSFRDEQTDIYGIDLATRAVERVTQTAESEYSPTMLPTVDGFSVIRVEADGTQRLWRFGLDGDDPSLVLEKVKPVGYHAWADAHTVALFVLGSPPTLQLADTRTGQADTLAHGIGRSLHRVPGTAAISFVHKETEDTWTIKTLDPASRTIAPVVETLPGREDYAWRPNGALLMADGAVLYEWTPERGTWDVLFDLSDLGVTTITRIAVSPENDYAALVVDRPEP